MKSLRDVCLKVEQLFSDIADEYRLDGKDWQAPINYRTFETLMMEDGFILSSPTIQQKWKMLIASNIFVVNPASPNRAFVNIGKLVSVIDGSEKNKKIKKISIDVVEDKGALL